MRDHPWNPGETWHLMSGNYPHRWYTDRVDSWEISPRELKRRLERGDDICILDVREPWEADICRLPDARLIPLGELEMRADDELDREQEIVVYCHHGFRSMEAAMTLWSLGFEKVKNLTGGIARWADEIEPDMPRY